MCCKVTASIDQSQQPLRPIKGIESCVVSEEVVSYSAKFCGQRRKHMECGCGYYTTTPTCELLHCSEVNWSTHILGIQLKVTVRVCAR